MKSAIGRLMNNYSGGVPMTLLSQFMPAQYTHVREGLIKADPAALVIDKVCDELSRYWRACGLEE